MQNVTLMRAQAAASTTTATSRSSSSGSGKETCGFGDILNMTLESNYTPPETGKPQKPAGTDTASSGEPVEQPAAKDEQPTNEELAYAAAAMQATRPQVVDQSVQEKTEAGGEAEAVATVEATGATTQATGALPELPAAPSDAAPVIDTGSQIPPEAPTAAAAAQPPVTTGTQANAEAQATGGQGIQAEQQAVKTAQVPVDGERKAAQAAQAASQPVPDNSAASNAIIAKVAVEQGGGEVQDQAEDAKGIAKPVRDDIRIFPVETEGFDDSVDKAIRDLAGFTKPNIITGATQQSDDDIGKVKMTSHHAVVEPEEGSTPVTVIREPEKGTGESDSKIRRLTVKAEATQPEATPVVTQSPASTPSRPVEQAERTSWLPTVSAQIETKILENLEDQKMVFTMELQPKMLGKIDVRMMLEGGKLTVEILSTSKTNALLSKQAEALAISLRENSPELTSVQVVAEPYQSGTTYLDNALTEQNQTERNQDNQGQGSGRNNQDGEEPEPVEELYATVQTDSARPMNYSV